MKINCGETVKEAQRRVWPYYCNWHDWFAWRPVRVGHKDCRWLEVVERKAGCVGEGFMGFVMNAPCDCTYRAKDSVTETDKRYSQTDGYFPW